MTQNVYDNEEFFTGYSRLRRSVEGLDGAPEWPALRALLPDLSGLKVLDLGCGFGWFCRWARQHGAAQVLGIDVSEKMLARARATTVNVGIAYTKADMQDLDLQPNSLDVAFSSLALHYVENLSELLSGYTARWSPAGAWSSRSSTRYSPLLPNRAGRSAQPGTELGPSTAIWTKARVRPTGSPRVSSNNIAPSRPISTC
jgi:2-polyprenyl-3-methyl-5-hydroxy-6-metoxy-1,4-benzoquinol methylase